MTNALRIAALPMYDADRDAVEAWWRVIAAACRGEGLTDVPHALDWPTDLDTHWRDPRLLLGQTCGAPLVAGLADAVQVVGAFAYDAPGCDGIDYRSRLLVRAADGERALADMRGRVAVVNNLGSHSGCIALDHAVRAAVGATTDPEHFFRATVVSGSHRASLQLVQSQAADIAAIDCVSLAGIVSRTPGALDGLAAIGWTPAAPGLPLITSAATPHHDLLALRRALAAACDDPRHADMRTTQFICAFAPASAATWTDRTAVHGVTE